MTIEPNNQDIVDELAAQRTDALNRVVLLSAQLAAANREIERLKTKQETEQ